MTFKRVYALAEKLTAKTAEFNRNELFNLEREKLNDFRNEMDTQFTRILNEMEGDLLSLRIKGFQKDHWKEFSKIYQHLIQLKKGLADYKPYHGAQQIISVIKDRHFKAYISTLNVIIQHFLQNNTVDLGPTSDSIKQTSVNSLNKLMPFADQLQTYMINNPLMAETEQTQAPIDARVIPDPGFKEVGPDEVTRVETR